MSALRRPGLYTDDGENYYTLNYSGTYRSVKVDLMGILSDGRLVLYSGNPQDARILGMPQVNKGEYALEVEPDDPEVSLTEVRSPREKPKSLRGKGNGKKSL